MRLDAARLKGCFGSWIPLWSCYPVKQSSNSARPERTRLPGRVFSFLAFTLPPHGSSIQPLDPENVEFFSPLSRSAARSPHSPDLRSRRADRPEGADRAGATGGFGGVALLNKATEARDREAGRGASV